MYCRLSGQFTTRSPLSHIGEAISTTSYLVQEPILQPDGTLQEVFCYSGNAWRGQLRDNAALYMLDKLNLSGLSLDKFHLLFSGGRIGGEQKIDLEQARNYRRYVPAFSLFGGGIDNQILPGKLRVSNAYPVCREAMPALPERYHDYAAKTSYKALTMEKSFSRKDDLKDDRINYWLSPTLDLGDRKKEGPADQMRMTSELLIAGVQLHTEIGFLDATEIELGAMVSALVYFARSPHIGGQANKGHGLVSLDYGLEGKAFFSVEDASPILSEHARDLLARYEEFLAANAVAIQEFLVG